MNKKFLCGDNADVSRREHVVLNLNEAGLKELYRSLEPWWMYQSGILKYLHPISCIYSIGLSEGQKVDSKY